MGANPRQEITNKKRSPAGAKESSRGCKPTVGNDKQKQEPHTINYIATQAEHHKKMTFREEYLKMLQANEIEYDERYV